MKLYVRAKFICYTLSTLTTITNHQSHNLHNLAYVLTHIFSSCIPILYFIFTLYIERNIICYSPTFHLKKLYIFPTRHLFLFLHLAFFFFSTVPHSLDGALSCKHFVLRVERIIFVCNDIYKHTHMRPMQTHIHDIYTVLNVYTPF